MKLKKKALSKLGVVTLSATMLAGGLAPSISFAKESSTTSSTVQVSDGISLEYSTAVDLESIELAQMLSEANEGNAILHSPTAFNNVNFSSAGTTVQVGNETIQTISDAEMFNLLEKAGVEIPDEVRNASLMRGAGTTKVVWTGAKSKGNVKLYLSKSMLITIQGLKVAGAIVGFIAGLAFQNYVGVAYSALTGIASAIQAGNIKHGRIYTISGWKYKGAVNQ